MSQIVGIPLVEIRVPVQRSWDGRFCHVPASKGVQLQLICKELLSSVLIWNNLWRNIPQENGEDTHGAQWRKTLVVYVCLDSQPELLVSDTSTESNAINSRRSMTWNTSYANNKLKGTKKTKCETRFKDLAAILSSLPFRGMCQKHLETIERCSKMVADFMADNEKRSNGLIT